MFKEREKEKIRQYYTIACNKLKNEHIACFKGHSKPVMLISTAYPGVWLEHVYDSVLLATIDNTYIDIAVNTAMLFIQNQKENGQLPCFVLDGNKTENKNLVGYSQTQECVSFGQLCLEIYRLRKDKSFLELCYTSVKKWYDWLWKYRTTLNKGLIEMFVGFDTGHDNSGRLNGMKYEGNKNQDGYISGAEVKPEDDDIAPIIAVDMNCNFYATIKSLEAMAIELDKKDEAEIWREKAISVKSKLFDICYDKKESFFFDVDKNNNKRKYLSSTVFHLFMEKVLDKESIEERIIINEIWEKHIKNPKEFWSNFPFPSMALNDASIKNNKEQNCWGYYSQALIALRCIRWMDFYDKKEEFDYLLEKWLRQWTFGNEIMFGQELDPVTGVATRCSEWYSSCMLLYVYAAKRFGIV